MEAYRQRLELFEKEGRLRHIPSEISPSEQSVIIDLSSNDYMGLATNKSDYQTGNQRSGEFSSVASRLLSRRQHSHELLEDYLGEAFGKSALLFNSGYHANTGLIPALAIEGTLLLSDKLIHASMIDGVKLSRSPFKRFRHNDMEQLEKIIVNEIENYDRIIVLTESIFSMDGDLSPLEELVRIKQKYTKILLYVDEAHGFGVRGETGLGLCEELGIIQDVDFIIGTLGKAAASSGAFVICTPEMKQYFINTARSFIFSTALPPMCSEQSLINVVKLRGMIKERKHLLEIGKYLTKKLSEIDPGSSGDGKSHIVPYIVGNAQKTVDICNRLRTAGFDALPIRRPTVAAGTERIRFSLNANISFETIDKLVDQLAKNPSN